MNVESFIKKLKESEEYREFAEELSLDEMSVTANVAGYDTPKAFAPSEKDFEEHNKETAEVYGYKIVPKNKKRNYESVYKQAMDVISEGTYKDFRKDETRSSNRKINDSIKNITLEPGLQFELSGDTVKNIHQTCNEINSYLKELKILSLE